MSKLIEAFKLLNLPVDAKASRVEESWRQLRSERHPDKGGSVGHFTNTKHAYQLAIAHATRPRNCPKCEGEGWNHVQRGWTLIKQTCQSCKGTGKVQPEEEA